MLNTEEHQCHRAFLLNPKGIKALPYYLDLAERVTTDCVKLAKKIVEMNTKTSKQLLG